MNQSVRSEVQPEERARTAYREGWWLLGKGLVVVGTIAVVFWLGSNYGKSTVKVTPVEEKPRAPVVLAIEAARTQISTLKTALGEVEAKLADVETQASDLEKERDNLKEVIARDEKARALYAK